MRKRNRHGLSAPALTLLSGVFTLASGNAWAVAGAGPPDTGAAMEGLFYLTVGLMLFAAILAIWVAHKLISKWREKRSRGHDETG